jgi:hypothetical protein
LKEEYVVAGSRVDAPTGHWIFNLFATTVRTSLKQLTLEVKTADLIVRLISPM